MLLVRELSLSETADFLESAAIYATIDHGFCIVHSGKDGDGTPFVLVNDALGKTMLTLAMV